MSPFAAGCAICGADLEAARARLAGRPRVALPRPATLERPGTDLAHVAIAVVLALAASPLGLLVSLFWAFQRHQAGEALMTVAMLTAACIAVAALLAPVWFWSHLI